MCVMCMQQFQSVAPLDLHFSEGFYSQCSKIVGSVIDRYNRCENGGGASQASR